MTVRTVDERATSRRIRREWWSAAGWTLLGLVLSAVAVVPGFLIPGRVAAETAFEGAKPCAGRAAARDDGANCLRTIRGTVLSARTVKSGRTEVLRVRLRPPVPAPADGAIDLDPRGDLAESVRPGRQVDVTTWRNDMIAVSRGEVRETLSGLPDEEPAVLTAVALAVVWSAALAFIGAFGAGRRARCLATGRPVIPRVPIGAKPLAVIVVPFAMAFVAGHFWDAWTAVVMSVVLGALIAVPVTILALRWDREPSPTPPPGDPAGTPAGPPAPGEQDDAAAGPPEPGDQADAPPGPRSPTRSGTVRAQRP
ncbi:hypothetical protein [Streptomyces sp. NPDC127038]|uniref:hypothetical protein n=1 Tax=Streptomyces sp. NPDC127038 TaxID=3347114 RepID=UPI00365AC704